VLELALEQDKRKQVTGTVYILHFAKPYPKAKRPRHYIGFIPVTGTPEERLAAVEQRLSDHETGKGNPFVKAVHDAGIEIMIAELFDGTRGFERRVKDFGSGRAFCRICRAEDPLGAITFGPMGPEELLLIGT